MNLRKLYKYFQSRCSSLISGFAPPIPGAAGGVGFDSDGRLIASIPPEETARGRTIRLHEADHLRYTPNDAPWKKTVINRAKRAGLTAECAFLLINGLEDARISVLPIWEHRSDCVRRDAAATVLRELRSATHDIASKKTMLATMPAHVRDIAKCTSWNMALRAMGLLYQAYAYVINNPPKPSTVGPWRSFGRPVLKRPSNKVILPLVAKLGIGIGPAPIIKCIAMGRMEDAGDLLIASCKPEPLPPMPDLPPIDWQEGDLEYDDSYAHGSINQPSNTDCGLTIIRPPLTEPCQLPGTENPIETHTAAGYRIRRGCLAQLAIGIPIASPFIRIADPSVDGVVLIDASGSMHADDAKLRKLCELAPGATVMYYSEGSKTFLVIFAQNGKRLATSAGLPNHYDGNGRDDLAIRFALAERARLKSDKPLVLITDCGFDRSEANELTQNGIRSNTIELIGSINEAIARFSGHTYAEDNCE